MARLYTQVDPDKFHRSQLKIYAYMIPIAAVMLLPIIYIFNNAFKPLSELFAFPPRFFVEQPTFESFARLFGVTSTADIPLTRYLFNSIMVTGSVIVITATVSSMGGYALSKMVFRGKKFLLEINNIALMFVAVAVQIPRYLTIQFLGIGNTYLAHILPLAVMPVGLFLVKQFVDQVPDSLIEAAKIDGASEFTVYRRIVLPIVSPAVATACILAFQASWNNLESSIFFVDSENLKTMAFYMNTLTSNANIVAGQGMAAAASLVMFIPNILLFVIMQSRVMSTMAQSGIK